MIPPLWVIWSFFIPIFSATLWLFNSLLWKPWPCPEGRTCYFTITNRDFPVRKLLHIQRQNPYCSIWNPNVSSVKSWEIHIFQREIIVKITIFPHAMHGWTGGTRGNRHGEFGSGIFCFRAGFLRHGRHPKQASWIDKWGTATIPEGRSKWGNLRGFHQSFSYCSLKSSADWMEFRGCVEVLALFLVINRLRILELGDV